MWSIGRNGKWPANFWTGSKRSGAPLPSAVTVETLLGRGASTFTQGLTVAEGRDSGNVPLEDGMRSRTVNFSFLFALGRGRSGGITVQ